MLQRARYGSPAVVSVRLGSLQKAEAAIQEQQVQDRRLGATTSRKAPWVSRKHSTDRLYCTRESPIPSATRLASLWCHLASEMREFEGPSSRHHPAQLHLSLATITRDIQALHPQVTAALTSVRTSTLFYATNQPAHRARMYSLCCRLAGAYPDTVPVSPYLHLSDADFICVGQFRLGATGTNPSIPATSCYCVQHVQGSDIDHAMTCKKLSGSRSHRHDDLKEALICVTARAGCSNRVEPVYNEVGTAAPGGAGSREDIEAKLPLLHGSNLLDVSLTHSRAATDVTDAAAMQGAAAVKRNAARATMAIIIQVTHLFLPQ